jgi:hypothetical protein
LLTFYVLLQGASVPNLLATLKQCYLSSVAARTYPEVLDQLHHRNTTSPSTLHSSDRGEMIQISARSFMRAVKEVRPAVVQKNDMFSLLVDSIGSAPGQGQGQRSSLVCVEALQERLRRAVLLPYLESKVSRSNSAHGLGGCSGQL